MSTSGQGNLIPNSPIVNLGNLYINGAVLTFVDGTHLSVGKGQVRDSTDTSDIIIGGNLYDAPGATVALSNYAAESGTTNPVTISNAVTINTAVVGAGGIDAGAIAASSLYAVYVIGDSRGFKSGSALISLNFPASAVPYPSLPLGYDMYRYVGSVSTDGAAALLAFTSITSNLTTFLATPVSVLSSGNATVFTPVVLTTVVPSTATGVYLLATLTSDAGGARTAGLKATSSTSTAGQVVLTSPASTVTVSTVLVPVSVVAGVVSISYLVSNAAASLSLSVTGFVSKI